ncbi:hypothetical protein F0562_019751 [Nyssa sinensis]|uniref:Retrotransposon Copia-like N-terminal domain-containing protein n=1 Tax=Nyssa sinensis TaxID=561372 RepID=A0A5J5BTG7_9ASTE|nr:hypothetical protein F0562_019751 [Nyssa sinensis]
MSFAQLIPAISPSSSSSPSTTTHHTFSVKLTPSNYLAWKTQFIPLLNYQNLIGFIDGTTPSPPKTKLSNTDPPTETPNSDYENWFKKDQLLHSWILSSLSEEIFPYVVGLTSSYEVWNALSQAFGSISQNRQLQLHIELQELKRNDMSVSAYLQRLKGIADELQAAGRNFSPAEFNAIIYRNIGSEFHPIITALNLRPEPVSFHELHESKSNSTTSSTPWLHLFTSSPSSSGLQGSSGVKVLDNTLFAQIAYVVVTSDIRA